MAIIRYAMGHGVIPPTHLVAKNFTITHPIQKNGRIWQKNGHLEKPVAPEGLK
ncbi:hypothetical protein HH800_21330 [Sphingobium yanoikuyae]|uniref:Uncharacterized protein n=1 Tax=Sphingobium yanoikuyae TaxID=13690 RepID=A0A6M4GC05_SPHYA|nr:hypothetical protein [Sphingobium yanoikuyae]QJR04516.1 hypothetical protein HH800_21330 [Sphingobium yanoikuyae]